MSSTETAGRMGFGFSATELDKSPAANSEYAYLLNKEVEATLVRLTPITISETSLLAWGTFIIT